MTANLPDWMNRPRCDQTPAWRELGTCYAQIGRAFDLRQAFAAEPDRFDRFGVQAPHVFADLSRNRIDAAATQALLQLAQECRLEARRDAMFGGQAINTTEGRAVLHTLAAPSLQGWRCR
jgi:glucose-6-phosphate isomerase